MKKALLFIIVCISFVACNKEVTQQEKFSAFLNTVPDLKFPFKTNSNEELQTKFGVDTTYKAFINESANEVYGKFTINDSVYGVVFLVAGDIVFPLLTTYHKTGKKIEELALVNLPGGSDGYNATGTSYLVMNQKFDIQITDTLHSFERDSVDVIIEASRKTEVFIENFSLGADGKFFRKELSYENKH